MKNKISVIALFSFIITTNYVFFAQAESKGKNLPSQPESSEELEVIEAYDSDSLKEIKEQLKELKMGITSLRTEIVNEKSTPSSQDNKLNQLIGNVLKKEISLLKDTINKSIDEMTNYLISILKQTNESQSKIEGFIPQIEDLNKNINKIKKSDSSNNSGGFWIFACINMIAIVVGFGVSVLNIKKLGQKEGQIELRDIETNINNLIEKKLKELFNSTELDNLINPKIKRSIEIFATDQLIKKEVVISILDTHPGFIKMKNFINNQKIESQEVEVPPVEPIPKAVVEEKEKGDLTTDNLIIWWNECGSKGYKECEMSLKEYFGDDITVRVLKCEGNNKELWHVININKGNLDSYQLPRKMDLFSTDIEEFYIPTSKTTSNSKCKIKSVKKVSTCDKDGKNKQKGDVDIE